MPCDSYDSYVEDLYREDFYLCFCWTAYWGFFAEGRSLYQTIICFLWFLFKANCCERAFTVHAFNHQAILAQAITNHTYQASTDHRYWLSLYFFRSELFTWFILFYNSYFLVFFALLLYCLFLYCSFTFAGSGSGETTNHPPQPTFHWGKDWDHYPLFLSSSDIFLKTFHSNFLFISFQLAVKFALLSLLIQYEQSDEFRAQYIDQFSVFSSFIHIVS